MFVLRALLYMTLFSHLAARNGSPKTRAPQKYLVNLDLPAEQRWINVAKDHARSIRETILMFRLVSFVIVIIIIVIIRLLFYILGL